ncbi:acyltransferase [Sphingomonas sp. VNH70]|uniref:acyltransferase family protein n=1 Tax=Sphingomonas silueang TaxID=3156617 RepID=UPI0032B5FBA9
MVQAERGARPPILDGVQYLRGLAALLVVVGHGNGMMGFPQYFGAMAMRSVQEAASFGVAVFFVISGFIIVTTSLDPAGRPSVTRGEFLRRRAVRILPFLWLCTIGYNLLSWAGTGVFDWAATLRTLLISPVGELKPNVAWSLRHELLFYLLFALLMLGDGRRRWLLWLWIAIVPPLFLLVYTLGVIPERPDDPGFMLFRVTLMGSEIGAHLQFGVGMALGLLHRRKPWGARIGANAMLVALLAGAALVVLLPHELGLVRLLSWSAAAGGIVTLAIVARPWGGPAGRGAILLGNASFAVYLVHNPVLLVLFEASRRAGLRPEGAAMLGLALGGCVLVALVAGAIVHRMVERPLIRAIDRRTRPPRPRPAVPLIADGA